jgi:hypothetical protein
MRYKVFIAYSGRSSELGDTLNQYLSPDLQVELWPHAFQLGESTFEGLLRKARQYDFGIFAFSPDDFQTVNGRSFLAPNVVLELGVFAGAKGKERAFLLIPESCDKALPADLQGITYESYDSENLETVSRACSRFRVEIRKISCTDCHFLLNRKSGKCLDVEAFGKGDGNPVIQWPFHGGPNQLWSLEEVEEGWFKITSQNSKKCLQVRNASQEEDAPVEQGGYAGKSHQQWSLTSFSGAYQIRARHSGKCLTVQGGSEDRLVPVVQHSWQQDDSFLWWMADIFTPT